MADEIFENSRLAAIYDPLDGDRRDLDLYAGLVRRFGASSVLDIGCGTGSLAVRLAVECAVVGVDPAEASLDVAKSKPGAERVEWVHGYVDDVGQRNFDLAAMTGNVSQAIVEPDDWARTLSETFERLRPGGRLVFESRDPSKRAWDSWNNTQTPTHSFVDDVGEVVHWNEVLDVNGPLVTFRWTFRFEDGEVLSSDSTLRFRERREVVDDLEETGFVVDEVLDAPDRPGLEFVFVARRPESMSS